MRKRITHLNLSIILLAALILTGCAQIKKQKPFVFSGFYFDTYISITVYDEMSAVRGDEGAAENKSDKKEVLKNQLEHICIYYDQMFSEDMEGSDIYKLNNSNGQPVEVSEETAYLINKSIELGYKTEGALDLTIQSVSDLWDFTDTDKENCQIPADELLAAALQNVDFSRVQTDGNLVTLGANQKITLGFIGKGYIADRIKDCLLENNISNAIINLGGNILCMGNKNDGSLYRLGISKPFDNGDVIDTLYKTDISMVTSGLYERYFIHKDVIYHHIIDTKTGYPVHNYKDGKQLYGVTVIGESSEVCDCLSTVLFIYGQDEGTKFLENYDGYGAAFVYEDNSVSYAGDYK